MPSARIGVLVAGQPLDAVVLAQLTRAEVRESDCDPSVLALRFSLVQRADGEFGPLDDDLFVPGTALSFEVAPPGGLTQRLFEGVLTHVRPHFESVAANAYLEVLAMDAAVLLDAEERVAAWRNVKDSDVVTQVLAGYQLGAEVADTAVFYDEDRQRLTQRATDWRFLQHLARRNGARFYFEYDDARGQVVGHFGPPDVTGPPQPDLVILQEGECLNWADLQLLATGPITATASALDPIAKRIVRGAGTPTLEAIGGDDAAAAVEAGLTGAGATAARALVRDPFPLDEAIGAETSAATDAARFVVELRAELDPALYRGILRARRPVLVRGTGRRFSGIYYVQSVRTTLQDGALLQTFTALRNATGQSGSEAYGQSAEEVPAT
ncbi:phage late control D family protein [Cryptosporangium aurantiacum]|uniref:Phage late control gene D protein (GPD) n=1 Tax=Cryptosporangium aurantiacum TaxID=134849 RepID=A0A1M7PAR4_9ACTN|nr:contractile injection system protein, VgrG/Pvc8 family [Cryptosporangium aurantiacum]SHN13587.1 Phage late control gene D protein (GPD) [Cryptosporangium aurantiacum]